MRELSGNVKLISSLSCLFSQQRHKNVVAALGLCIDVKQIYMVSEFVNGESLRDLLKRDDDSLTWPRKVKLVRGQFSNVIFCLLDYSCAIN